MMLQEDEEGNRGSVGARELAECEEHARAELVRDVFDRLEDRIVQYHTNLKAQIALLLSRLERTNQPALYGELRSEIFALRKAAAGVSMLAQHVGYLSETEFHGAHRRRLATLTIEDLPPAPAFGGVKP